MGALLAAAPAVAGPFYFDGLRQGMSKGEYDRLLDQGHFLSRPGPMANGFFPTINGTTYMIVFCNDRLDRIVVDYTTVASLLAVVADLQSRGFKVGPAGFTTNKYGLVDDRTLTLLLTNPAEPYELNVRVRSLSTPQAADGKPYNGQVLSILYYDRANSKCGA